MHKDNCILERLHFRELALRFLDSFNPRPDKAIVIADAICSYDMHLTASISMRCHAHDFVQKAILIIEQGIPNNEEPFGSWLTNWNRNYGCSHES